MAGGAFAAPPPKATPVPPPAVPAAPPEDPETARLRKEAMVFFGRTDDDRTIVYVRSGVPDGRQIIRCPELFREVEVWTYLDHPKLGKNARMVFFPEPGTGAYRYWMFLDGEALLFAPEVRTTFEALDPAKASCSDAALLKTAVQAVTARQKDPVGGLEERATVAMVREAQKAAAANPDAPAPAQLLSNKPLTGKERKKGMEELPEKYRQFLEDVDPIVTDLERDTLLRLKTDYQRDRFVEEFWKRRSFSPDGLRIPMRDIWELRVQQARKLFRNLQSDRPRIYLVNGPPDGVQKVDCPDIYWPVQIWYYERIERLRLSKVYLLFYQQFGVGDYKLWTPTDGAQALIPGNMAGVAAGGGRRVDVSRCGDSRDVQRALSTSAAMFGTLGSSMKMLDDLSSGEKPGSVEGVDAILQMTTDVPPDAVPLMVQRTVRFPEMFGNKMRVELAMLLEREALTTKKMGEETFLDIDVVGEIVKGERLIDNFRYRFDFPASSVSGPFLPLTIERDLYPGEYKIRVKVADANRNAAGLIAETLKVPDVPDLGLTADEKAAREAGRQAVARLVAEGGGPKGALTLLPIAREFATGLIRFETRVSSPDVAYTEFWLDNRKITTDRKAPFEADLDLGTLPRKHAVKVIGYSRDGKPIATDELLLNEGREAFRVRIGSPEKGARLEGATRVIADVAVPETKKLKQVEIYVNEKRAATLYQEPFQQVVEIPKSKDLGFVRVVATLADGTTAEDLRYYNAPKYLSEETVQAVELYTTVLSKNKPVTGLSKEAFSIFEDGVPQAVEGFEVVTNLPLSLGIAIDTSGSMEESITDAEQAAVGFLKDVMTPRDRCFLVNFDNEPQLVSRFTTDRDRIAQALAGMRAQGSTALWDAIVYGLYQYQGVRGRKAYVILTDGEDRSSKFPFEAALDYAKKSGVALYFIGLRIPGSALEVRHKLGKLARETGGNVYYVAASPNLSRIYAEINEELRSQYLLTYLPQNKTPGNQWRKIEVKMTPSNLVARTISGYYP